MSKVLVVAGVVFLVTFYTLFCAALITSAY